MRDRVIKRKNMFSCAKNVLSNANRVVEREKHFLLKSLKIYSNKDKLSLVTIIMKCEDAANIDEFAGKVRKYYCITPCRKIRSSCSIDLTPVNSKTYIK